MRKRTVSNFFDNIMWYLIYLLPIIITILTMCFNAKIHFGDFDYSFTFLTHFRDILTNFVSTDGIVYNTLNDIFGATGIFSLFNSNLLILYFTYFINCLLIHTVVDILALIPRIAHKLLDKVVY